MRRLLLIFVCVLSSAGLLRSQPATREWSVQEIFGSPRFQMKTLSSVRWMDGGRKFSYFEIDSVTGNRNLVAYHVADGRREIVMPGALLIPRSGERPIHVASYQWSQDGKRILVTGSLPARRMKTGGNFGVYEVEQGSFRMLTDTAAAQSIIKLSPDGTKVGFVRGNNLHVMDLTSGVTTPLTTDGSDDILNGKFDWVYEEEFSIIDSWEWSPDSRRIAFWRLDQSAVSRFPLVRYRAGEQHADVEMMRYPKTGEKNSLARIGVVDVGSGQTVWLDLGPNPDQYIPRIQWTHDPLTLSVQRLNRAQDTLQLLLADVRTGSTRTLLTETDSTWVDVQDDLRFLERSPGFLWTSSRDGFHHIYLYDLKGSPARQVTRGEWDVTEIVHVSERRSLIYFMATQASPLERHLYSIRFDGTGLRRLSRESGWHSVRFSPDGLVYLDTFSSTSVPSVISLHGNDGTMISRLVENRLGMFRGYPLGSQQFFRFRTSDGYMLNGWMLTPSGFDSTRRYPVLLYVYGSGRQTAINRWGGSRFLWHQMMAQKGYVVVSVDGRGTEGRGKRFRQISHRRLGIPEALDQIETARYLAALPFVDSARIGIWGWSGGGYMTLMAMSLGPQYFKAGMAVAPVTDFRFYNTIWTERYMGKPQENPDGYRETAPLTHASKLAGDLLLVHGTVDDNVHWQHTILYVDELIRNNKRFQTMFYPGRTHSISGGTTSVHLYSLLTTFLLERL